MKFIRVSNPIGVDYMREFLEDEEGIKRDELCERFKEVLKTNPETLFLLQAWDGEELCGFVVSFAAQGVDFVRVGALWTRKEDESSDFIKNAFLRVCMWAESLERTEIRVETRKALSKIAKRWNFKLEYKVLSFQIPEDLSEISKLNESKDEVVEKASSKKET